LPDGWLGKHWACQQLSEAADGELLLFTDADTRHGPGSLRHGAAALHAGDADLLTAFPHEETVTWAEKLVVPVVPWAIFTFLPLALAYRTSSPAFSATIGQYMLFRASAYAQIGGHSAVRSDAVDDIALGRRIKAQGFRWRLADATHDVHCRMYQNAGQVFEGFSKNLFAGFGYRLLPFLVTWVWLVIAFLLPLGVLLLRLVGAPVPAFDTGLALIGVTAGLASWGLAYLRFGIPAYLIPLYPITLLLALYIALRSVRLAAQGQSTWKGRTLVRNRVRWW
jgi:chlorobactene glucosyltransferase